MLLSPEAEDRIAAVVRAVANSYSVYLVGRQLGGSVLKSVADALGVTPVSKLTFLEQSYLAGKAAQELGTDKLRTLSQEQLIDWLRTNSIQLTAADQVTLDQMKKETLRWIEGRSDAWQAQIRQDIGLANSQWRAVLATSAFTDAAAMSIARNSALLDLKDAVSDTVGEYDGQASRLLQTQMAAFFQQGQVANRSGDEMVYKVPRATACRKCIELHWSKGAPKLYRLKDVLGNSNVGLPQYAWKFTVGPTHPHCYCMLYFESDRPVKSLPGMDFAPLKKSVENSCGVPDDPQLLFDEQLALAGHQDEKPDHIIYMIAAVKKVYGDRIP